MSNYQIIDPAQLAETFKALGHPHRLQIFLQLATCCAAGTACSGEDAMRRCVGELAADLDIAQPTVSHHLKELTRAGLIATERCGREIRCWVEPAVLRQLGDFFSDFVAAPPRSTGRKSR
jgi:ArsR family transcriptional regulator